MKTRNQTEPVIISIGVDEKYPDYSFGVVDKIEHYSHGGKEPVKKLMVRITPNLLKKIQRARGQVETYDRMMEQLKRQAAYIHDPTEAPFGTYERNPK